MQEWLVGLVIQKIIDKIIEKIIDKSFEYFTDQSGQRSMKEELLRLQEINLDIQRVVAAFNNWQIRDQSPYLDRWLWQLRDAADEADDLLDEFEYLKHKEHLTRNTEKTKGKKRFFTSYIIEIPSKIRKVSESGLIKDPNLNRLKEVVQNLVNVSADVDKYSHLFEDRTQKTLLELNDIREIGALPNFIGRCGEMEYIMQWLRNSSNEDQSHVTSSTLYKNISLLFITGYGGMGKTTLSQHVYNNIESNEFEVKMWVCVSHNFDVNKVIAGMLESHTKSKCELNTLDALQGKLMNEVRARKFLLVLDDIWEDKKDASKWEKVFSPLVVGSLGSKILVTTRMESVPLMIAKVLSWKDHKILTLEAMKKDDCLQLLYSVAIATGENLDAHKKSILEHMVTKVLGSPLAAKLIGGVVRDNMNESYWEEILNSDIGSTKQSQNILFPILILSYMYLPKPLQSCFSFCSIFPQDHKFYKDELIRMWIALNFIQPSSNPTETLEDIGERYFDILIKKSFFEKFQYFDDTDYYKMHDLLHELTQFVSTRECCRVMSGEELSNCETIRHLSVKSDDLEVFRKINKFKKLRSLFLCCQIENHSNFTDNSKDFAEALSEIFKASSSIRLLLINAQFQMPEAIGDLMHLRYLNCDNGRIITKLPRSIGTLYHMNFIIYRFHEPWDYYVPYDFLPEDMNNLFNLRYAELPWKDLRKRHWIGEVRPLQRLNNFFVKNKAGYRINELEHMNELWELRIYQLENVKDAEEACSAKFCSKGSLTKLSLHWGNIKGRRNNVRSDLEEEVFDNLQPDNKLKQLTINAYMGTRSAIWMNEVYFISNLESITLEGCLEWQILPFFGQLRFLKSLYLSKMPKIKNIDYGYHRNNEDCTFPSLEVLHIEDLNALECLPSSLSTFSSLKNLKLASIPLFKSLPDLPPSLEKLSITNLKSLVCLPSSLSTIFSLRSLNIDKVPLLQQLPDLPSSLRQLIIRDCHKELKKRYDKISGFERDKVAHIFRVYIKHTVGSMNAVR